MERKHSFPPVTDARTRILILGSLPGERSLAERQYYAHPQNRFWELVGGAIDRDLRSLRYRARLTALLDAGIGLWDVIAHAQRRGSLDSAIRYPVDNDLVTVVHALPRLAAIAFNGQRSSLAGRKLLHGTAQSLMLIDLPSSSPAYAAMPFAEKLVYWQALRSQLGQAAPNQSD